MKFSVQKITSLLRNRKLLLQTFVGRLSTPIKNFLHISVLVGNFCNSKSVLNEVGITSSDILSDSLFNNNPTIRCFIILVADSIVNKPNIKNFTRNLRSFSHQLAGATLQQIFRSYSQVDCYTWKYCI